MTVPVLAKETFGVGASGFGAMQSSMSIGAIVGGLLFATRTAPTLGRVIVSAAGFGTAALGLALSPTYGVALIVLPLVGAGSVLFMALTNAALQLASSPEMRSRVMALYAVAFIGSTPVGGPLIGWITETFGVRWALAVGGIAALLGAAAAAQARRGRQRPAPEGTEQERALTDGSADRQMAPEGCPA